VASLCVTYGVVQLLEATEGHGVTRVGLFISSYAPLFLILAVRFTQPWLVVLCGVLTVVGIAMAVWILRSHGAASAAPLDIVEVDDGGEQAATYLITYLLPFVAVDEPSVREVVAYGIFVIVGALVYVRSDMQVVNPLFYALRRRILKVKTRNGRTLYAIARRRLLPGPVTGREITPGVLLVSDEVNEA
jgi:hypothetical protein